MGRCHEYAFDCELSMHGHQPDFQWQRFLGLRVLEWVNCGSAMFVMGNSFESGLNRDCNDTRKTISAAFGAGRSVASEVRGLRGAGEQGCDSHRGEAATVGQPKVPAL